MVLGIVLHASNVYSPQAHWIVSDPSQSPLFDWLGSAIHSFRMPAFFWVSGYFCALTLQHYGSMDFLRKRVPRLAIPLLFTWATLNALQVILLARVDGRDVQTAMREGIPLYHLWFLVDLLVFFVLAVAFRHLTARPVLAATRSLRRVSSPMLQIVLLALFSVVLMLGLRASGLAYIDILGLTTPARLGENFPFFLVGMLMFSSARMRNVFFRVPPALILPAVALWIWADNVADGDSKILAEFALMMSALMTWVSVAAVIGLFERLFARGGKVSQFLSDSSYSIYLFHHLVVTFVAILILGEPWSPFLKFPVVVLASFLLCAAIHQNVIRYSPILLLAFNGKWTLHPARN